MHDFGGFAAVLMAILAGAYINNRGLNQLEVRFEARMNDLETLMNKGFDKIESRLDRMQADSSQFYRDLGDHAARIDLLEKRLK